MGHVSRLMIACQSNCIASTVPCAEYNSPLAINFSVPHCAADLLYSALRVHILPVRDALTLMSKQRASGHSVTMLDSWLSNAPG